MALKSFFRFIKRVFRNKKKTKKRKHIKSKLAKRKKTSRAGRKITRRVKARKTKRQKKIKKPILANPVGIVTHYYPNVKAAVVKLKKPLKIGEPILIKGKTTDFRQTVGSMQIDRKPIEKGKKGQEIGLEVMRDARQGDIIYTLSV